MTDYTKVSTREIREAELDAELAELEAQQNPKEKTEPEEIPLDPNLSKAEVTWASRYSELRSHAAKKENEWKKEKEALLKQLEDQTKNEIKFPKSASMEEVVEWARERPDVAAIIEAIAEYKVGEKTKGINEQLTSLNEDKLQLAKERAFNEILKVHPDLPELIESDHFQQWIDNQPIERGEVVGGALYNALAVNDTDPVAAIKAINIYKQDLALEKKPRRRNQEELAAATTVRAPATQVPQSLNGKKTFLESEIEAMNNREYDRFEKDIEEARREGRITYDISGAAR